MKGKEESTEECPFETERRKLTETWWESSIAMPQWEKRRSREEREESQERPGWRRIKEEWTEKGRRNGRREWV
jgi:hypothetical protein